jgi:hypothetical protein
MRWVAIAASPFWRVSAQVLKAVQCQCGLAGVPESLPSTSLLSIAQGGYASNPPFVAQFRAAAVWKSPCGPTGGVDRVGSAIYGWSNIIGAQLGGVTSGHVDILATR